MLLNLRGLSYTAYLTYTHYPAPPSPTYAAYLTHTSYPSLPLCIQHRLSFPCLRCLPKAEPTSPTYPTLLILPTPTPPTQGWTYVAYISNAAYPSHAYTAYPRLNLRCLLNQRQLPFPVPMLPLTYSSLKPIWMYLPVVSTPHLILILIKRNRMDPNKMLIM